MGKLVDDKVYVTAVLKMKKNMFNNVSQLILWLLSCTPNTNGNVSIYEMHISFSSPFLYVYIYLKLEFFLLSCLLSRCSTTSVVWLFFYFLKSLTIKYFWIYYYIRSCPLIYRLQSVFGRAKRTVCASQLKTWHIYFSYLYFPFPGTGLIYVIIRNQLSFHLIFRRTFYYQF